MRSEPSRGMEAALVLGVTALFAAGAIVLPAWDRPLGTDWQRYLMNAVAVAEGDWDEYQAWRGPLHAWATAWVQGYAGGLVHASQAVAIAAATACLPLTWWLGRLLLGPWPALLGLLLLAGWPDLVLFARFSSPYVLLTALCLLAAALVATALKGRRRWAIVAGLAAGLAMATDLRAAPLTAMLGVGALAARGVPGRHRFAVAALLLGVGAGSAELLLSRLPVALVPLSEQVALQRDLNGREGPVECRARGRDFPTPLELVDACGRSTFAGNLARARAAVPLPLVVFALVAALGLWPHAGRPRWGTAFLLLPALPALPSLLLVGAQHRYALPLLPFAALLLANGLARVGNAVAALGLATGVIVAFTAWPGTLVARARGDSDATRTAPAVVMATQDGPAQVARLLAARGRPGDRVIDCARGALRVRLFPTPVEEWHASGPTRASAKCRNLLRDGPAGAGTVWLLVKADEARSPVWALEARYAGVGLFRRGG